MTLHDLKSSIPSHVIIINNNNIDIIIIIITNGKAAVDPKDHDLNSLPSEPNGPLACVTSHAFLARTSDRYGVSKSHVRF